MKIIALRKIWFAVSGLSIAASIIFLAVFGLKLGLDFTGGSLLEISFAESKPGVTEISEAISDFNLGEVVVQTAGDSGFLLRSRSIDESEHRQMLSRFEEKFGKLNELRFESIGPVLGEELKKKAIAALLMVFAAITFYIAWSFRRVSRPVSSWVYGIVTLATAFHDIIIPLGLFSLLGKLINVEIGGPYVAAILTIMGYSINDTIVVLDRVRENVTKTSGSFEDTVEKSVKQTLARSVNTSLTTTLALLAVFFFGGESLKWFSLALIAGIVTGTYSSIFIASPLLVVWEKWRRR